MLSPPPPPKLKIPVGPDDHVLGEPAGRIELVEYGDYQCPHCQRAAAVVHTLRRDFGADIRYVFRHFPLSKMHPLARRAAQAAEAAGAQGKFWEMHDILFARAPMLEEPQLLEYAGEIGLDVARVEADLTAETFAARVQADVAGGVRSGVNGTPTFFINGLRHNGGYTLDLLGPAVAMMLGK